ncbi:DUF3127 domain-containing protein [Pollutibacter soli]|uniref:DUF3127 domain-containing protein n=1 Tax=Pollutibacter soli TaxID=3034157 RepID=UPI0030139B8C
MGFEVTGKLVAKFDTVQKTETFKTREFVIETSEDIGGRTVTNFIKFQTTQDRTSIVDRAQVGETVKVHFNLRGTKWEKNGQTSYFTNLDAWRIESVNLQQSSSANTMPAFESDAGFSTDAADDLPF